MNGGRTALRSLRQSLNIVRRGGLAAQQAQERLMEQLQVGRDLVWLECM